MKYRFACLLVTSATKLFSASLGICNSSIEAVVGADEDAQAATLSGSSLVVPQAVLSLPRVLPSLFKALQTEEDAVTWGCGLGPCMGRPCQGGSASPGAAVGTMS